MPLLDYRWVRWLRTLIGGVSYETWIHFFWIPEMLEVCHSVVCYIFNVMRFPNFSSSEHRGLFIHLSCFATWGCKCRWCICKGVERGTWWLVDHIWIHVRCVTHATNLNSKRGLAICWAIKDYWRRLISELLVPSWDFHLVVVLLRRDVVFCLSLFWTRCLRNLFRSTSSFLFCNHMLLMRWIINSNDHTTRAIVLLVRPILAHLPSIFLCRIDDLSLVQD